MKKLLAAAAVATAGTTASADVIYDVMIYIQSTGGAYVTENGPNCVHEGTTQLPGTLNDNFGWVVEMDQFDLRDGVLYGYKREVGCLTEMFVDPSRGGYYFVYDPATQQSYMAGQ